MYEKMHQGLAPKSLFILRLGASFTFGMILIIVTLIIGMLGLIFLDNESHTDAFSNAAMILSSVGTITNVTTKSAKIFCGFYSLISNFIYITVIGIMFAPLIHRKLHQYHLDT